MKILLLSIGCVFLIIFSCFAQTETITLTTYYPAPYGVYQDLEARRMVIGTDDMPTVNGVINFQDLGANPTGWADSGAMYYNSTANEFRFFDGTNWVSFSPAPCMEFTFSAGSGTQTCPAGYNVPMAPLNPTATSGTFLCCRS